MLEMNSIKMETECDYIIFFGDEDLFVAALTNHQLNSRCVWKIKGLGGFISFDIDSGGETVDLAVINNLSFEKDGQNVDVDNFQMKHSLYSTMNDDQKKAYAVNALDQIPLLITAKC